MKRIHRVSVASGWLGLLTALALLVSACGGAAPAATAVPPTAAPTVSPAEQTGSLTVLDWAGYDAADFWTDFKGAYPKVTVNFEIGASDADIYAKMHAGDKADIFHPYTGWLQFYVDEGLSRRATPAGWPTGTRSPIPSRRSGRSTASSTLSPGIGALLRYSIAPTRCPAGSIHGRPCSIPSSKATSPCGTTAPAP